MMKVLHVTPSYYPALQFGGPIQSVRLLNKALKHNGVDVKVLTTNAGLTSNPNIKVKTEYIIDDIPVVYMPFTGYEHYNLSLSFLVRVFQEVAKVDLVHITAVWNFPVIAATLACLWHNKPYVLSPRGTIYPETVAHRSSSLKKLYYKLIAQWSVKKADMLHFTTSDEAESVTRFLNLKNPFCIIPNGLDLSLIPETSEGLEPNLEIPTNPYLLFLGRIDKKKGLDIFLPAFKNILQDFPDLTLWIIGPDNEHYSEILKQQAEELSILNSLKFSDPIDGQQKWKVYKNAKAFVLTSYSENFGMTVAEAMACNCPILISNKVAIQEFIINPPGGWICDTTSNSIEENLRNLLSQPIERENRARQAQRIVRENFNLESLALKMITAYHTILKSHVH